MIRIEIGKNNWDLENYRKSSVELRFERLIQTASKKEAFAESFIKKRQPNVLIGLFMHFPFEADGREFAIFLRSLEQLIYSNSW